MKKLIYLVIGLISITACKKEQTNINSLASTPQEINQNVSNAPAWGRCCVWMASIGDCPAYPANCYDEVVISKRNSSLSVLEKAVKEKKVKEYFISEEWKNLFPAITQSDVQYSQAINELRSGKSSLKQIDNNKIGKSFFISVNNNGEKGDGNFVFQFRK